MRTSPWMLGLAVATVLAACQPASDAEGTAPAASSGTTEVTPPAQSSTSDERVYAFQCGDLAVQATYRGQDSATIVVGGRTFPMSSEPAASGAKFSDGQGNTLWTKGTTEGTLSLKGEPDRACTGSGEEGEAAPEAGSNGAAPNADVVAKGFRATGNEPGWLAQVSPGATPTLHVQTNMGEQTYDIASPTHGQDGWSGKAADGTEIKLTFQRTSCQDTMSGREFPATAMLTVAARQYHGCGDFSTTPAGE